MASKYIRAARFHRHIVDAPSHRLSRRTRKARPEMHQTRKGTNGIWMKAHIGVNKPTDPRRDGHSRQRHDRVLHDLLHGAEHASGAIRLIAAARHPTHQPTHQPLQTSLSYQTPTHQIKPNHTTPITYIYTNLSPKNHHNYYLQPILQTSTLPPPPNPPPQNPPQQHHLTKKLLFRPSRPSIRSGPLPTQPKIPPWACSIFRPIAWNSGK